MSANTTPALGTLLKRGNGDGPPETFTTISDRVEITGPSMEMGERETTDLDSTVKEFRPSILDPGELDLTINFQTNNTGHQQLLTDLAAKTISNWRMIFPLEDGSTTDDMASFSAWVKKFEPKTGTAEDTQTADVTLRLTSVVTIGDSV